VIASVAVSDLVELVWVSLVATIVLSVAVSLCVLGVTRAGELRRSGESGAATAYLALGIGGAGAVAAGVVGALLVIITG
jgi:hypothetical protein